MLNLSGENVQKAWNDNKNFLTNGLTPEQVFKIGFVMGEAANKQELPQEPQKLKKKINRKRGAIRTPAQIQADTNFIANLLKNRGPMQLKDITKSLNKTTGPKWHEKSASSFLAKSMEINPNIEKVGYGVYGYAECSYCDSGKPVVWRDVDGKKECEECHKSAGEYNAE